MKGNKMKTEEILEERGSRYGSFESNATISQALKRAMMHAPSWKQLKPYQKEALEMIVKLAKGLRELKYAGSRHRDIRTSNILFYKDKGWVLADFGNSAIDQEILTHSSRTIDAYLSNENRYLKEEELKIPFDHNEDIWQLGVTYYCVLKGIHTPTLWKEYKDKRRKNRKLHFYEFLYDKINSENFEEKTKYYLKRLMGMMEREDVPKDCIIEDVHPFGPHPNDGIPKTMENDVKRYRVIDEFIDEYEGKPKPDFNPTTDIIVSTYEKKVEKVRDILVEAEKNRDPYLHLIEDRYIESLTTEVKSLQEFCSGSDKEKIADKYLDFMEEINLLIDKEYKKIDEEIDKVIINFNNKNSQESLYSNEILRVFYEKIFLWGPPFTESKRERPEEKAKYSFKETMDCNTHYHKEKNWTSFVNLRTRNELLKKVAEYI